MWKRKQQSNYSMRNWLCKVFLLVWFFGFAVVPVKAELTQAQVQAAFESALVNASLDGVYDALISSMYNNTVADMTHTMTRSIVGVDPRFWDFLRTLSPSNQLDVITALLRGFSGLGELTNGWGYATADTLHSQMDQIEYYLQGIWGSAALQVEFRHDNHGNELLVAAPDIEDILDTIEQNQRTIATLLIDLSSGDRSNFSSNFYEMGDYIAGSVSNSAAEIIDYLDQDVSSEYDDSAEDAEDATDDYLDEYDDIPLTSSSETYNTQAADPTGPETSDIFGDLSTSGVSHSAILQLVDTPPPSRSTSIDPIPDIEVDFGRDGAFTGFCASLNDLTDWLYPILGTFFLSLKGLRMWRLVRQATIAASASGAPPVLNLAYDPF